MSRKYPGNDFVLKEMGFSHLRNVDKDSVDVTYYHY